MVPRRSLQAPRARLRRADRELGVAAIRRGCVWRAALLLTLAGCEVGSPGISIGHHTARDTGAGGAVDVPVHAPVNVPIDVPSAGADGGAQGEPPPVSIPGTGCILAADSRDESYAIGAAARLEGGLRLEAGPSGNCLTPQVSAPGGAPTVEQRSCAAQPNQIWQVRPATSGWFSLVNLERADCLDVSGGDSAPGTPVIVSGCDQSVNQEWQAICAGNDTWQIVSHLGGLALQVTDASRQGGAVLVQEVVQGLPEQAFRVTLRLHAYWSLVDTSEEVGQPWRFSEGPVDETWASPSFDDSSWSEALGPFGDDAAEVSPRGTRWQSPEIWLRRGFSFDPPKGPLSLRVYHRGNTQIYLNGVEAFSGVGPPGGYRVSEVSAEALASVVPGFNVLAVHSLTGDAGAFVDAGLGVFDFP